MKDFDVLHDFNLLPTDITRLEIEGVKKETDKAYLINFGDEDHWIPKSQASVGYDNETKTLLCVDMPGWLAKQKKLI